MKTEIIDNLAKSAAHNRHYEDRQDDAVAEEEQRPPAIGQCLEDRQRVVNLILERGDSDKNQNDGCYFKRIDAPCAPRGPSCSAGSV